MVEDGKMIGNRSEQPAILQSQRSFTGDITVEVDVDARLGDNEDFHLAICDGEDDPGSGLSLCVTNAGISISEGGAEAASAFLPPQPSPISRSVRFDKHDHHLLAFLDDSLVLQHRLTSVPSAGFVTIWTEGDRIAVDGIALGYFPTYSYVFDPRGPCGTELCDWHAASGRWDVSINLRSLAGRKESEQDAIIWHKKRFPDGDVAVDFIFQADPERDNPALVLLAGSGQNQNDGYLFTVDAGDAGCGLKLSRNGHLLKEQQIEQRPRTDWGRLQIRKSGGDLSLTLVGTESLTYHDDDPVTVDRLGLGVSGEMGAPVMFDYVEIFRD
jgi:hypothetical protein